MKPQKLVFKKNEKGHMKVTYTGNPTDTVELICELMNQHEVIEQIILAAAEVFKTFKNPANDAN